MAVLGVVVVTHQSEEVVGGCLRSIDACAGEVDEPIRTVVADNESRDGTLDVVRASAPGAQIVDVGHNAGYAAGVNAGVAALPEADAVLLLNPDIRLQPGALAALRTALDEHGTGITVPRMVDEHGHVQPSLRRRPTLPRAVGESLVGGNRAGRSASFGEMIVDPAVYERPGVHDWATGAAMMISRACLADTGPWDESFFLYSEETDFALRAADAGHRLRYVPEARVVHLGGEAMTSPTLYRLLTRNRVRLYGRRHGAATTALYRGALAVGELLRAPRGATHRAALAGLLTNR